MGQERLISLKAIVLPEGGAWVAHCLDLDIVEEGANADAAMDSLAAAVKAQIAHARDYDNWAYLFTPAPREVWQKYAEIIRGAHETIFREVVVGAEGIQRLEVQRAA